MGQKQVKCQHTGYEDTPAQARPEITNQRTIKKQAKDRLRGHTSTSQARNYEPKDDKEAGKRVLK